MQQGYFAAAWQDIKNSPGWIGKLLLLGLVCLIPIFGWLVVAGYFSGSARDKAWGVHAPLPASIFGNEDGKLYSRGLFVLLLGVVCSLLPCAVEVITSLLTGGYFGSGISYHGQMMSFPWGFTTGILGFVLGIVSIAACFFAALFFCVGAMRVSIYGRLSAGFQIEKIWNMIRHDFNGILRILGMSIVLIFAMSVVAGIAIFFIFMLSLAVGFLATGGNMDINASHFNAGIWGMVFAVGGFSVVASLIAGFVGMVFTVFVAMMVARALGYWTQQFNVAAWRGQDDPMPVECDRAQAPWQPPLR